MRRIFAVALVTLMAVAPLCAANVDPTIRRFVAEAAGTLTIEPDGTVSATTLPDELQPALRDAYAAAIRRWTFEPIVVDGRAVRALGHMRLAFAIELKGDAFQRASIERVTFVDASGEPTSVLGPGAKMHPPSYPMELARDGIGGEVILAVETDADGRILRAAAQSGSVYANVRARDAARAQRAFGMLARASVHAARNWEIPGCRASVCTVPVRYTIQSSPGRAPFWLPAHEIPVTPEPWMMGVGVVALGADGAASSRFRLKTSVDGMDVLDVGG